MMQTSTPLIQTPQRNNLRKSVLLRDATNMNMSLRRLSNVAQTPINQVVIDDDLERNLRRSEAELHKRVSNIGPSTPKMNEKEIRDHFQICLKMFAENKISSKNAWNLKIIDYIRTVISLKGQAKDTLQVAGTSLDVSAKIYGIRVDDIHSDGLKLASNMARVNPEEEELNDEDNDENDPDKTKAKDPKRKRHKARGPKITVAKDINTLIGNIPKMESIFFQTRMNLEASSTDNLFTNKLPLHPYGHKFMLLNKDRAWSSYNTPTDIKPNTHPMEIKKLNKISICAQFANFEIDEWDPDNEKEMLNFDRTMNEEVAFDADGIPIPELDGSVHDLFANNAEPDNYCSSDEEEEINGIGQIALQNKTVAHVVDFKPEDNDACADEYNYSNSIRLMGNKHLSQVWAGPSHWKLKYIKPTTSRFSGQAEKPMPKSTKKAKFVPSIISFYDDDFNLDKTKFLKSKRRAADDNPYKCTLPQVLHNATSKHPPLISKLVYLDTGTKKKDTVIDKEVEPYNYENPNDSQYCAENGLEDCHSGDDGEFINEEAPLGLQQNLFGDNLVDAPELVPKTYIPYAMQAKKMDMKKLKTSIWKSLVSTTVNEIVPDEDMYKKEVQPTQFSSMYQHLPERLTEKMQNELSCPLAFVAILHLANEQNLQFEGQPDLSDFSIKQQKEFVRL